jgi:hypothetical protein
MRLTVKSLYPRWQIPPKIGLWFLLMTTALYYTAVEPSMSHIPSLFSVSLFLFLSFRCIQGPTSNLRAFLYGASAALMIMVRNQNVFFLLVPLIYLLNKPHYSWKQFFYSSLGGLVTLTPQFVYWHTIFNDWILYSYQGESFDYWSRPKLIEVLFSPISGLVTWHPVHVFSITGLFATVFNHRTYSITFLLILVIQLYLFASWECWWLGDSFGYRGLANVLPLLFIGFVWVYKSTRNKEQRLLF